MLKVEGSNPGGGIRIYFRDSRINTHDRARTRTRMRVRMSTKPRFSEYDVIYLAEYLYDSWTRRHGNPNQWNGQMDDLCAGSFPYFKSLEMDRWMSPPVE